MIELAFGSESGCDKDVAKISLLNAAFPLVSQGQTAPADSIPNSPAITIVRSGSQVSQHTQGLQFIGVGCRSGHPALSNKRRAPKGLRCSAQG
jgi:hypothetical protein